MLFAKFMRTKTKNKDLDLSRKQQKTGQCEKKPYSASPSFNPLPSSTLATFFLTAVGLIQHTNENNNGREKTILMT
jgi:hypothetical protein